MDIGWTCPASQGNDISERWGCKFPGVPFCKENGASIICTCMHEDGWEVLEATPRNLHLALSVGTPGAVSMVTI